eukprot:532907_1
MANKLSNMVKLLFSHIVLVLFYKSVQAEWILSTSTLPRKSHTMAIGSYNQSIYILGAVGPNNDHPNGQQLVEYDIFRDEIIDHGVSALPRKVYGETQHHTQIDNTLYIIDFSGQSLVTYNMETNSFNSNYQSIPTTVGEYACLASRTIYLYVVGGYGSTDLDIVQVLDLTTNSWLNSVPSMQEPRTGPSCIVDESFMLYAIGGYLYIDTMYLPISSIERIYTNNIDQNNWAYIEPLHHTGYGELSVLYNNNIYHVGGLAGDGNYGWTYLDTMQIINTATGTVSESPDQLPYTVAGSATIIVGNILYAFGGYSGTEILDTWMKYELLTTTSTDNPSEYPSENPSTVATDNPTQNPSTIPTDNPSPNPTLNPSSVPTRNPQTNPTIIPTSVPTDYASPTTTYNPSIQPTNTPASHPMENPSTTAAPLPTMPISSPSAPPIIDITSNLPSTRTPTLWAYHQSYKTTQLMSGSNTFGWTVASVHAGVSGASDQYDIWMIVLFVFLSVAMVSGAICIYNATCKLKKGERNLSVSGSALHENMEQSIQIVEREGVSGIETVTNTAGITPMGLHKRANQDAYEVQYWLQYIVELPQYFETFMDSGYEAMGFLEAMSTMIEVAELGIESKAHQIKIWQEIKKLKEKQTIQAVQQGENTRGEGSIPNHIANGEFPNMGTPPQIVYAVNMNGDPPTTLTQNS